MSEKKIHNFDEITKGALAVLISLVHPKEQKGLTTAQTAAYLNMSVTQLNFMRHNKKGPGFYKKDGKVLYKPSSIRAFIQSNTIQSQPKRRVA